MQLISKIGGLQLIQELNRYFKNKNILLVTGKQSFEASGAKRTLEKQLRGTKITRFFEFSVNPKLEDAMRGVELARLSSTEVIVAVGGGSVIDMAKLIKAFYACNQAELDIATGQVPVTDPNIPLLAVPTTAGSGSEATHFAVVYVGNDKYSLADTCLLPDVVILDGSLALAGSKYQKSCNSLDAMAQAIESSWAAGSTHESREYAFAALESGWNIISKFVATTCYGQIAQQMLEAANFAGRAINISKTTAAHAWSYSMTSSYHVPHGHAVWLTLPQIFEEHETAAIEVVTDFRGAYHLKDIMRVLRSKLNLKPKISSKDQLKSFLNQLEVEDRMELLGLDTVEKRLLVASRVNAERMGNNPVDLSDAIPRIFNTF